MALIRKIVTCILAVAANLAYSQKEAENWYFAPNVASISAQEIPGC